MTFKPILNPITQKRFQRFKEIKRAYYSLLMLIILYIVSIGSEIVCNDIPYFVRFNGRSFFPILKFYPEDAFTGSGRRTRPDYIKINSRPEFKEKDENYMIFPPIPFSPNASVDERSIAVSDDVTVTFTLVPMVGTVNIKKDY